MKNSIIGTVYKKEMLDLFRDKKTIVISILIPLLIFPLLFSVMGRSMNDSKNKVENNVNITIIDKKGSNLGNFLKEQKDIKLVESKDIKEDVKEGKILLAVSIPEDFEENIEKEIPSKITITYDNVSQQSNIAKGIIASYVEAYSKDVVAKRLGKRNVNVNILNPIQLEEVTSVKEKDGMGKFLLSLMLPLMLVIYSVTGPIPAATDLGAGEKERGTLEPLLTTAGSRMSLLWGKFFAITTLGLLTNIAAMGGIFIAMKQKGGLFSGAMAGGVGLEFKAILIIGLISILNTMVFGALELAISIYARSFKEASTYITPLTILVFVPTYATYMLDAKNIEMVYFNIPFANAMCVMKEVISGIYNYSHMFITFGWIIVYILFALIFARYMFNKESVIFRN